MQHCSCTCNILGSIPGVGTYLPSGNSGGFVFFPFFSMAHHETNLQGQGFVANLVCKRCSPQNYQRGGGPGWVKSGVAGCKVGWVGLVQNTPPSYKRSLVSGCASLPKGPPGMARRRLRTPSFNKVEKRIFEISTIWGSGNRQISRLVDGLGLNWSDPPPPLQALAALLTHPLLRLKTRISPFVGRERGLWGRGRTRTGGLMRFICSLTSV